MKTRVALVAILVLVGLWTCDTMSARARLAPRAGGQVSRTGTLDRTDRIFFPDARHQADFVALQKRLVAAYGGPNGVWNALVAGYFIPPHLGAVITGAGVALANWSSLATFEQTGDGDPLYGVDANHPSSLLYAPTDRPAPAPTGLEGAFDDIFGDPPFELVGWFYILEYNPGRRPHVDGLPDEAWFVHEAGWHMSDGSQILTPPREECPGVLAQDMPSPPGPVLATALVMY